MKCFSMGMEHAMEKTPCSLRMAYSKFTDTKDPKANNDTSGIWYRTNHGSDLALNFYVILGHIARSMAEVLCSAYLYCSGHGKRMSELFGFVHGYSSLSVMWTW
jgi:hypothetical protein